MKLKELLEPFDAESIEWRVGPTNTENTRGLALPYVTARAIQDRLDNVCGPENWRNEYERWGDKGVKCGISIKCDGEWVPKFDGADESEFESTKSGFSASFKRCAVVWGIGRYLYKLPSCWVPVVVVGKSVRIEDTAEVELAQWYQDFISGKPSNPVGGSVDGHSGEGLAGDPTTTGNGTHRTSVKAPANIHNIGEILRATERLGYTKVQLKVLCAGRLVKDVPPGELQGMIPSFIENAFDWQRIANAGGSFERAQDLLRTHGLSSLGEVAECFETGELPADDLPF